MDPAGLAAGAERACALGTLFRSQEPGAGWVLALERSGGVHLSFLGPGGREKRPIFRPVGVTLECPGRGAGRGAWRTLWTGESRRGRAGERGRWRGLEVGGDVMNE